MELCLYRALIDIGVHPDRAEAAVKAIGDEMD